MRYITSFESLFELIEVIDFKLYSLKCSKRFFKRKKYYLKNISLEKPILEKPESIYWSFNNKLFGDYCRETSDLLRNIISLYKDHHTSDSDQFTDESIILRLKKIQRNDKIRNIDLTEKLKRLDYPVNGLTFYQLKELTIERLFSFRDVSIRETIYKIIKLRKRALIHYELAAAKMRDHNYLKGVNAFCWNKKRDLTRDIVILHTYLRESDFIDKDTPIRALQNAFNCSFINMPLEIRWTKKVKGKLSKGLLFHFIDQLEHLHFIDITIENLELFAKFNFVFCDSNGKNFNNLDVSKSQWLNQRKLEKTPQELELESILFTMLYSDPGKSLN